jgi:hypothetical protein
MTRDQTNEKEPKMKSTSIAELPPPCPPSAQSQPTTTSDQGEPTWGELVKHLESKFPQDANGRGRRDTLLRGVRLTAWAEAAGVERVAISRLMRDVKSASRTQMGTMDSLAEAAGWTVYQLKCFLFEASRRNGEEVRLMGTRNLKKKVSKPPPGKPPGKQRDRKHKRKQSKKSKK